MKLIGFYVLVVLGPWENSVSSWKSLGFHIIRQRPPRRPPGQIKNDNPDVTSTSLHLQANHNNPTLSNDSLSSSSRTALCIVPPDESWDTLQRARHFANDQTYRQWPPAIRLFHPFCPRSKLSNVALDLASIVEKHDIQPFPITLNQWTVMPLPNNMENLQEEVSEADDDSPSLEISPEDEAVMELIELEAQRGKERKKERELRKQRKQKHLEVELEGAANVTTQSATATLLEEEQPVEEEEEEEEEEELDPTQHDEFNGPAMIALEPDDESIRKLQQLRELFRHELQQEFDPHAPSLWDSPVQLYDDEDEEDFDALVDEITSFRPLIPMGAFPSIDAALTTAKKLKGLWDPLTFEVTDLHFLSQVTAIRQPLEDEQELYNPTGQKKKSSKDKNVPFGCDAQVMLMGEEIEQDDEVNDMLAKQVWEEGTPGGYERQRSNLPLEEEPPLEEADDENNPQHHAWLFDDFERKLDAKEGDWENLVDWLDGDEEDDFQEIGTAVVIGRTHLFSGEARSYDGMPASSIVEDEHDVFSTESGSLRSDSILWIDADFHLGELGDQAPES